MIWLAGVSRVRIGRGRRRQLHTNACDDLAAAAAALPHSTESASDGKDTSDCSSRWPRKSVSSVQSGLPAVVPAEEQSPDLPGKQLASADAPIGAVRWTVGDRLSVFEPELTNRISELATAYVTDHPGFAWQRKLMVGGAC